MKLDTNHCIIIIHLDLLASLEGCPCDLEHPIEEKRPMQESGSSVRLDETFQGFMRSNRISAHF